uniref:protein NO VEIN domain-containing protein n=1 Tax=Cupriavidus taiwanensis TaxID=164546 RepID=UPI0018DE89FF|nr:DUF3883 domain-containing protein [Cupriavidus taiwanensis]
MTFKPCFDICATAMSEPLSPGVAYGCFELLDVLERTPMSLVAAQSLGKLGVISSGRATKCAILLGWAEVNDNGMLVPTVRGYAIRAMPMTSERLRAALLDLVEATDPPWIQSARFGRRQVLDYSPPEIAQICREAGLATGSSPDVVAFWDRLAARARGLHDVRLNETGREGERLTLQYEEKRTGRPPKWIALDSNLDGYDVLSCMGPDNTATLCIEVKASRVAKGGEFYLTRHEWETAQVLRNYQLHLWDLSAIVLKLAVVDLTAIAVHLPTDCGGGNWDCVRVPFSSFADRFEPV